MLVQAATHTGQAVLRSTVDGVIEKMGQASGSMSGAQSYEWVKGLLGKKEWRVQCLDVLIRI